MADFRTIVPAEHSQQFVHQLLLSGISPRPIALVGTLDAEGHPNLSPFSFFNAFGANPPVLAISPANRGSDGSVKHTLLNIDEIGEFTVSAVPFRLAEHVSLASSDYPRGVDEFVKSGLTHRPSLFVRPPSVLESPFSMECRVLHRLSLGEGKGSGNLVVGEVLCFHYDESYMKDGILDQQAMDLVGRCGGPWYVRASGPSLFTLPKPRHCGIGFDSLPDSLRRSPILTGAELARLAGVAELPDPEEANCRWAEWREKAASGKELPNYCQLALRALEATGDRAVQRDECIRLALNAGDVQAAWDIAWLMASES